MNFLCSFLILAPALHGCGHIVESFNGNFLYSVLISVPVLHGGGHIAGDFAESLRRFKAYGQKTLKSQPFKRKACENQLEKSGCTVWA